MADPRFPRGARPSPRHVLAAARPFQPTKAPPAQLAYVPPHLDFWGNNQYGDCVSAEEAFAKACYSPEIFIPPDTVVAWARNHGYLNGADLVSVMDSMRSDGFAVGPQKYEDGPHLAVDYSNEALLQAALAKGPVKIAIDAGALPQGAGNQQGWYAFGGGRHPNTDHCVSVCGFGPTGWLFGQLKAQPPPGAPASGYLLFTWSTIGVVDHAWLMGTCVEAWVRDPTTVGVPPLPGPNPGPAPDPGPAPATPVYMPMQWPKIKSGQLFHGRATGDLPHAGKYGLVELPSAAEVVGTVQVGRAGAAPRKKAAPKPHQKNGRK